MKKIIKVREYTAPNIDKIKYLNLNIIECIKDENEDTIGGYDCIIAGDNAFLTIPNNYNVIRIITNDLELDEFNLVREKDIVLNLDDEISNDGIPEFGLSTDTNINICQLNIPMEEIDNIYKSNMYWGIDGNFHYHGKTLSKEKLENEIINVQRYGCSYPLILYIDHAVRTYLSEFTIYICKLLNKETVPCRFMFYKDIKYIENINSYIYNRIRDLPSNNFYEVEDKIDISPYMVINYSDKRKIISEYVNKDIDINTLNTEDGTSIKLFPLSQYIVILPFFFNDLMREENDKLLTKIKNKKYPALSIGKEEEIVTLPIGKELSCYLHGYSYTNKLLYYGEERNLDEYKGFIMQEKLDIGKFDITNFNYDRSTRIVCAHGLHKLQADFIIPADDMLTISGLCVATNDTFNKENLIVKVGAKE